jgi:hypothetical protein
MFHVVGFTKFKNDAEDTWNWEVILRVETSRFLRHV